MLQPLQLEEVSARYPREIPELRAFLAKAGLALGAADTIALMAERLRTDRAFHRDLALHVWVTLHAVSESIGYADLLGMLALAAAGPRFAAEADEADAHALLRFLMEARRSADPAQPASQPAPAHPLPQPEPLRAPDPLHPQPRYAAPPTPSPIAAPATTPPQVPRLSTPHAGDTATPATSVPTRARDIPPPWTTPSSFDHPDQPAPTAHERRRHALWIGLALAAACLLFTLFLPIFHFRTAPAGNSTPALSAAPSATVSNTPAPSPSADVNPTPSSSTKPAAPAIAVTTPRSSPRTSLFTHLMSRNTPEPREPSSASAAPEPATPQPEATPAQPVLTSPAAAATPDPSAPRPTVATPTPSSTITAALAGRPAPPVINMRSPANDPAYAADAHGPRLLRRRPPVALHDDGLPDSAQPARTSAARGPTPAGTVRPTSLGIMAGNLLYSPVPDYPAEAATAHVQGEVKIEAEVDRNGNVGSARVVSGPPLLRDAALDAVQRWHFRPYMASGKPIPMGATAIVDFELP